jgi:1-deoxy-D-xylulose-5-phosphate reductoisomerase
LIPFSNMCISVLGSTGSIGRQTLDVCRSLKIRPVALTAHSNLELLEAQAREFLPQLVVVAKESLASSLKVALADTPVQVKTGPKALEEAATLPQAHTVVGAIVGVAGLAPVLAAAKAGKTIALANKEPLVSAGALVTQAVREHGARLLPVDSEHSAIFQCLHAGEHRDVVKILLTASGGPFFGNSKEELAAVTAADALKHPNWVMGAKVTVDSATLMNKGLEFIEAMWLFDLAPEQIEVVVHRQSIVHSGVFFADGSLIAQMGVPDMRAAIQYALTYPRRYPVQGMSPLSLTQIGSLTFASPDRDTFPCLAACEGAARKGGLYPAAVNGANEGAVALFLDGKISFLQIGELVQGTLEELNLPHEVTLASVLEADAAGREYARQFHQNRGTK